MSTTNPPCDDRNTGDPKLSFSVVIAIVGCSVVLLMALIGAVWWAGQWTGSIQAKLDVIIANERQFTTDQNGIHTRVESLERAVDHINAAGSPKLTDIEKQFIELKQRLDLHIATSQKATP